MAYIDFAYYSETFMGTLVDASDFPRLADRASDIIDALVSKPVPLTNGAADADVKKATAYQVEVLAAQGGVDAVTGYASGLVGSESLGNHSISVSGGNNATGIVIIPSMAGIPISRLALAKLSAAGLRSRWAYAGVER